MSETEQIDRRVRRTRQSLQQAVLDLAATHDTHLITVQEITRQADINRATFYQHYRDRDHLLNQTYDSLLAELTAECGAVLEGTELLSPDVVPPSLVSMMREISRRADLYRRLLDPAGTSPFLAHFQHYNERLFLQAWAHLHLSDEAGAPPEARARFAAASAAGLISWWLENNQPATPEAVATWLWRLSRSAWFEPTSTDPIPG